MGGITGAVEVIDVETIAPARVGAGCRRHDLPAVDGIRAWVVDIDAGCEWPHVDAHPDGEDVFVVSGELIEGERRLGAGQYLHFAPGSSHQPRSERGVRLIGWNPRTRAPGAASANRTPASAANAEPGTLPHRVLFDFTISFANGGGLDGRDFRLDIASDTIDDAALAELLVRDLRLLMVGTVDIRNKRIVAEAHKRGT